MLFVFLMALGWALPLVSIISVFMVWDQLPDIMGVHFSGSGEFDVFDTKWYIMYPYIISFGSMLLCSVFSLVAKKVRVSKKMTSRGQRRCKMAVYMLLLINGAAYSLFYGVYWPDCVVHQRSLDTAIPRIAMPLIFAVFVLTVILLIVFSVQDKKLRNKMEELTANAKTISRKKIS